MLYKHIIKVIIYTNFLPVLKVQSKKPNNKRLLATWRLECELGIVIDPECPVDGGWSHWAPWSTCLGSCDNVGHRKRKRYCNNPLPSKDGLLCNGVDEENEACYLRNCSVNDYRMIIEGDSARTEALRQLEAVPVLLNQCLQMECPYEAIEAALATENTWQLNAEVLWNALQCVKHDLGCFLNGEWSTWGSWSACGARCGKGLKWRLRRCDTPPPSVFNLVCLGIPLQSQECEGDQCAIDGQYTELGVSGTWSEWGSWTKCSEKCGTGVRRRKRTCTEKRDSLSAISWRTHCRGQHDEFEICDNKKCFLDGGWSGWGVWGQCSQTCGAGKRSRTRSCTRPIPSGGGADCIGNKIDIDSCHLTPCEVYRHLVAVFNGDSVLQYKFNKQNYSTFIHTYIRFLALSPHGTLMRRGRFSSPMLRISLHKWHICIDSSGPTKTCSVPRTCSPVPIEPSMWHSIMVSVTNEAVTISIDNANLLYSPFPCDPEFINDEITVIYGERLHGEIQEIILNFIPLFDNQDYIPSKNNLFPTSSSNIAYEKSSIEEGFINLDNEYYLQLPCFEEHREWQLEVTIKSTKESGIILYLSNHNESNWFYMILDNLHLKIKFTSDDFKSEALSSTECLLNQWLDIKLNKRKETNTIEVLINGAERLHVLLGENSLRKRRRSNNNNTKYIQNNSSKLDHIKFNTERILLCSSEYFVGGIPLSQKHKISEDISPFYGTIASLKINNKLMDLHKVNIERYKDGKIQLSSRSASISDAYIETFWGESNNLNLTCVYARGTSLSRDAFWLYLDTGIQNKNACSLDNGRVLRLTLLASNDRPGFYTCRASVKSCTRNFITYGVLGKTNHKHSNADVVTVLAFITTICLVIFTLGWLIVEGYNDVCEGYGFFRDDQLTSEEKLENYSERNTSECCESVFNLPKVTRRRCRRLSSQLKVNAHDTQSIVKFGQNDKSSTEYTNSEPDELPALPEIKNSVTKSFYREIYRCEPICPNLPIQGSKTSTIKTKTHSSSETPRRFCSRTVMNKYNISSKEIIPKSRSCKLKKEKENKSTLLSIKSSSLVNNQAIQKVLQRFYNLKHAES